MWSPKQLLTRGKTKKWLRRAIKIRTKIGTEEEIFRSMGKDTTQLWQEDKKPKFEKWRNSDGCSKITCWTSFSGPRREIEDKMITVWETEILEKQCFFKRNGFPPIYLVLRSDTAWEQSIAKGRLVNIRCFPSWSLWWLDRFSQSKWL